MNGWITESDTDSVFLSSSCKSSETDDCVIVPWKQRTAVSSWFVVTMWQRCHRADKTVTPWQRWRRRSTRRRRRNWPTPYNFTSTKTTTSSRRVPRRLQPSTSTCSTPCLVNHYTLTLLMLSTHGAEKNKQCFSNHLFYFCSKRPHM